MSTIRRRYWYSRRYHSTIDRKPTSSFPVLKKTGLKLSMAKRRFGIQEVDFLGRTKTTKVVAPQGPKILKVPEKKQISTVKESFSELHRILELLSKLYTQIGKTINSVFSTTQNNGFHGEKPDQP